MAAAFCFSMLNSRVMRQARSRVRSAGAARRRRECRGRRQADAFVLRCAAGSYETKRTHVLTSSLAGACRNRGAADAARRRSKLQVFGFYCRSLRLDNARDTALVGTGMV